MVKILVIVFVATVATAIAERHIRSPGGTGWQGTNRNSGWRSALNSWAKSGNGLGRWRTTDIENLNQGRGGWGISPSAGGQYSLAAAHPSVFTSAQNDFSSGWDNSRWGNGNNGWDSSW